VIGGICFSSDAGSFFRHLFFVPEAIKNSPGTAIPRLKHGILPTGGVTCDAAR
jgi:hypothetical protein